MDHPRRVERMTQEESMGILVRNSVVMKVMIRIIIMAATTTSTTTSTTSSTTNSIRSRIRNQCRIYGQGCGGDINNHGRFANFGIRRRRRRHRNDVVSGTFVFPTLCWLLGCKGCLGKDGYFTVLSCTKRRRMNDQIMHMPVTTYNVQRQHNTQNLDPIFEMVSTGTRRRLEYQRDTSR
jgi:hypothetical protein